MLPRTHAGGGESDIVYKYLATKNYPSHDLLIECTLSQSTGQRHMEMEPVSRHLATYMIKENKNAYCSFVSNELHPMVISDFRGRKAMPFYLTDNEYVESMKILMLDTEDLRNILQKDLRYSDIYKIFDEAFCDTSLDAPPQWYKLMIKEKIANYQPMEIYSDLAMAAERNE